MSEPITVACVCRSGGIYNADWVLKLKRGVKRNLSLPHKFVCLSDMDMPVERLPLTQPWAGWWSKLALFDGRLQGRILYFDLDSVIVGSLDKIASYPHRFTMAHDFYGNNPCSTAMAWDTATDATGYRFIYDAFMANPGIARHYDKLLPIERRIGDQAFIEDQLKEHGVPIAQFRHVTGERSIASYKVDKCKDGAPSDAAVVAFHGRPKCNEIKTGWIPQVWR